MELGCDFCQNVDIGVRKDSHPADEGGQEQPIGEPGEMLVRNNYMMGYWNMPEKTAEALRDDWLHTGDMGIMDREGYLTMLGRWSERIVCAGKVIYPRYMEETLLQHPAVHYAGVIAKPDAQYGQIALGVVELFAGQTVTAQDLLSHCQGILGLEHSPHQIEVIAKMPMTPTGKIGKQELIRLYV